MSKPDPTNYVQRVRHDPDNGQYGDCFRCCLAYVLGVTPERVPHFMAYDMPAEQIWAEVDVWLHQHHGSALVHVPFEATPKQVVDTLANCNPGVPAPYLLGGMTTRGTAHNVVATPDDGIVLDPGLPDVDTEVWYPLSNGYTWVNFVTRSAGD